MSPFRSLKNNITNSFSSVRAVEGLEPANDLRIGNTNAYETWTYAGRRYYAFTESGYFDVTESGKADIAIIGGGGSGGMARNTNSAIAGGGGGAGAFVEYYDVTLPTGNYLVNIGNGGKGKPQAGPTPYTSPGSATILTGPPTFSSPTPSHHPAANIIQAPGGGGGGSIQATPPYPFYAYPALPGGSGGGGTGYNAGYGTAGSGEYEKGWGHPGVESLGNPATNSGGGGGGGAGGISGHDAYYLPSGVYTTNSGFSNNSSNYRNDNKWGVVGGGGKYMFGGDQGIPTNYGTPGPGVGRYFAGGGSGANDQHTPTSTVASPGGGAHNFSVPASAYPRNGSKNTGGGGGGGYSESPTTSIIAGDGGSGIMIIRFKYY